MARTIRIPFLADLILADDPATLRDLVGHRLLDRGYRAAGPLINRIIAARVRRGLRAEGAALPSAGMRNDAERARAQTALAEKLMPGAWDTDTVAALTLFVRGDRTRPAGELAQEVTGRLFKPDYRADAETWDAALLLEEYLRSWNPIRRIGWALAGARRRAQQVLSQAAGGDRAAVHATGIAAHNLAISVERLADDWADPQLRAGLSPEAAAARALAAPQAVLRQATDDGSSIGGALRPGTLVVLQTRRAAAQAMDRDVAFLSTSWSRCPADRLVPALLAEIWRQAPGGEGGS